MFEMMPMAKVLRAAECGLYLGMLLAVSSLLHAQQGRALPVGVSFEFTAPDIVSSFDTLAERKDLETKLTAQFISLLQSRFHYWTFVLGSQGVNVSFKLDLQETDAVTLHVGLLNGTNKVNHWEAVVLKPGELLASGMPTGTSWLNKLPPAFDGGLLQQHNQEVLDSLKAVAPVGKETIFMPPPATPDILPRAVLALDSTEYNDLSECQFKLRYNWNVGGIATIHSSGIGMHAPFSGVTPPFDGIVVQLEDFSQGNNKLTMNQLLQNLPNLTPVEFFLEKIKGPGSE